MNSISLRLVVPKVEQSTCSTNIGGSQSQAILFGSFFNAGAGGPQDDVFAYVIAGHTADSGQLFVGAFAWTVGGQMINPWEFLGWVNVGEEVIMSLKWDPANSRFVAGLKRVGTNATVVSMPYELPNGGPPVTAYKQFGISNVAANCTSQRSVSSMTVIYDDVMVNASALP